MQILLCAATSFEIAPIISFIEKNKTGNLQILITGVGLTAATYQITKAVCKQKPDLIIQAGVAGSLDRQLFLTQVVVVKSEVIGDSGVVETSGFYSLFDLNLADKNQHPWTNGMLVNESSILESIDFPLVNGVSVNEISTLSDRIEFYQTEYNAQIESLEGAALHYAALMEGIPFIQLRSISNYIGERDKSKWQLKSAIENLNSTLQQLLNKLANA